MEIIYEAIAQAVKEHGQNNYLAEAIKAWFSELAKGNESIGDNEKVQRRIELLLDKTFSPDITSDNTSD